jgi:hypothetical protein
MEALSDDGDEELWERALSGARSQYPNGESCLVAFYRTLTRNETTMTWQHEEWNCIFQVWIASVLQVRGIPLDTGDLYSILSSISALEREKYELLLDIVPSNSVRSFFQQLWAGNSAHSFKVPEGYYEDMKLASEFYDKMKQKHEQETFFITTTGHMGTAFPHCRGG